MTDVEMTAARANAPGGVRFDAWRISRGLSSLLLIPAIFLLAFFLWPLGRVVARSLTDPTLGLQNYVEVFSGGPYLTVLWNTLETSAVVTLLCLLLAYPVAYVMAAANGLWMNVMGAFVIIPLWTSVVIRSYAWMVVFQRNGVLNDALKGLGLTDAPISFLPGALAVHVGMVHIMLPFMVLPLVAGMRTIDRSLLRAAEVMGATPGQAFAKIFLPLSIPSVAAGSALVFMMSLGFYITPALLGGPRHMMAAVMIEQQANQLLNWGLASALATLLLAATVVIYLVYARVTRIAGPGAGRR
jgi:putative spermidine/putrescine transport system permease protein/mannopine transport system permease protein